MSPQGPIGARSDEKCEREERREEHMDTKVPARSCARGAVYSESNDFLVLKLRLELMPL